MKHSFTDQQLTDAYKAALKEGPCGDTAADYMRAVVNHLPEPVSDEWQECGWLDILHTDERVKAEYISGTVLEGVPDGISDDGVYLVDGNLIPYSTDAKWYRIPAPVQHPDPAEHPVILVTEYDVAGNVMECEPTPFFAHDGVYKNDIYVHRPDGVLSWCPAKVVADDA